MDVEIVRYTRLRLSAHRALTIDGHQTGRHYIQLGGYELFFRAKLHCNSFIVVCGIVSLIKESQISACGEWSTLSAISNHQALA